MTSYAIRSPSNRYAAQTHRADGFFHRYPIPADSHRRGCRLHRQFCLGRILLRLLRCAEAPAPSAAFEEEAAKYWVSSEGLAAGLLLGSLGTLIGGFYAAYKAGTLEMKHGALVGVVSILVGLFMHSGDSETSIPGMVYGAFLRCRDPGGRAWRLLCRDVQERYRWRKGADSPLADWLRILVE